MKCPKCGFVSFDHLDNCKKCGKELSDMKVNLNVPFFVPKTDNEDEVSIKTDTGVQKTEDLIDTLSPDVLEEKPTVEAGLEEFAFEEEEDLSLIGEEEPDHIELNQHSVVPELILEDEGADTELELSELSIDDDMSLRLDSEVTEEGSPEEDLELFTIEDESSMEEPTLPLQPAEDTEPFSLQPSDLEVVELEEEEYKSSQEKS